MKTAELENIEIERDEREKLIAMLNDALNEEWLSYYQCWIGAILMEGPLRNEIKPELFIHANQELNHALIIKSRILQLGVTPTPASIDNKTPPRCQTPKDAAIEVILDQNLLSERSAIQRYKEIADFTHGKDKITHQMAVSLLNEELEHERRIEKWLCEIRSFKAEIEVEALENHFIEV